MSARVGIDAVILACVFIAPFWFTAILAIFSALIFHRYYEIVFWGMLVDAVYLPAFGGAIITPMTLSAIGAYSIFIFVKPRLRAFA